MTSIKLLLISDIKYSDRLTKGSVEYIPKGTICESTLEMWHECQPGTRYLRNYIPITIKGEKIREYVSFTTKDKDIVYTILDLLKKAEELEVFYKPAIYLQIRETTGQKTVDITRVIKILKSIMKKQSAVYYHDGALDIDETDIYNQHKY